MQIFFFLLRTIFGNVVLTLHKIITLKNVKTLEVILMKIQA